MKNILIAAALVFSCVSAIAEEKQDGKWVSLFNGKDLTGWTPKIRGAEAGVNHKDTFQAGNGVIRVDYSKYDSWKGEFGHLFYKDRFSHYRLRLQYRFTGEQLKGGPGWAFRNSGVMIHSEAPETMELNQDFPTSLEVQLLGGTGTGERTTGNLCTPGTHVSIKDVLTTRHCISSTSKTFHGDQWVNLEIEARGGEVIKHFINGEEVLTYNKPELGGSGHADKLAEVAGDKMISGGYICLQSESHPVEFRKIEIMILEP
jgi:hypothetical protein